MQWKMLGRVFYLSKAVVCLLGAVVVIGLVVGGYFFMPEETVLPAESAVPAERTGSAPPTATITPTPVLWQVYIVGAVKEPGLYALKEGALVHDAVSAAGGLLQTADAGNINLVQALEPNLMIRILTEEERLEQGRTSSLVLIKNNEEVRGGRVESADSGKININSATKEELMTLSGIGEARAESIIAYREENGPFQTVEDIMLVSGIKESAFAKIKDRITT